MAKKNGRIEWKNWRARKQDWLWGLYWRRNCILIHEIAENKEENTNQQTIDFINENLNITINDIVIDRSHKIGLMTR